MVYSLAFRKFVQKQRKKTDSVLPFSHPGKCKFTERDVKYSKKIHRPYTRSCVCFQQPNIVNKNIGANIKNFAILCILSRDEIP